MSLPAAVVAERGRQVNRGEPERGPELDDGAGAVAAGQHVEERAGGPRDRHVDLPGFAEEGAVVGVRIRHPRQALFAREVAEHLAEDLSAACGVGVEPIEQRGDGERR